MKREYGTVHEPPFPRNYAPEFLELERGKGAWLYDTAGKKYLDFGSGISVNALGYGRKDLAKIAKIQMEKLIHVSNLYTTAPAVELAQKLTGFGSFAAVHFGNSGAEANEAALKYARLCAQRKKGPEAFKLLSFSDGFHGRTMGALSVTPKDLYRTPFEPLVPGCTVLPFNDVEALETGLTKDYAAVIVEPLQGEGGLNLMSQDFAKTLNRLCEMHDVILIADEIQTGLGRLGEIFASDIVGLKPDIITLAKPLAGGLPLSATLIPEKINSLLKPGEHGTTFGGGPVTTAVALRVVETITAPRFLAHVREISSVMEDRLEELAAAFSCVGCRYGTGMLQGVSITGHATAGDVIARCREKGLLLLKSGTDRIRIAPPLIISEKELEYGVAIIEKVLTQLEET
ncbi:MAG: aspartate aminotransferase family protein [Spirochaetales bacterium]|nr:aspartate aminotransferase family protein [Spirochaetales bacterium]